MQYLYFSYFRVVSKIKILIKVKITTFLSEFH
jgi:hypothetical protein